MRTEIRSRAAATQIAGDRSLRSDTRAQAEGNDRRALVLVLLLVLVPGVAIADRVILSNGNVLEGRASRLDNGDVVLISEAGQLTLAAGSVARIESSRTLEDEIRAELRDSQSSVPTLMALARRSLQGGAETLGRRILERVLDLEPDHAEARRLLGFRRRDGEWTLQRSAAPRMRTATTQWQKLKLLRALLATAPVAPAAPRAGTYLHPLAGSHLWPPLLVSAPSPRQPGIQIRPARPMRPASGTGLGGAPAASPVPALTGPRNNSSSFRRPPG